MWRKQAEALLPGRSWRDWLRQSRGPVATCLRQVIDNGKPLVEHLSGLLGFRRALIRHLLRAPNGADCLGTWPMVNWWQLLRALDALAPEHWPRCKSEWERAAQVIDALSIAAGPHAPEVVQLARPVLQMVAQPSACSRRLLPRVDLLRLAGALPAVLATLERLPESALRRVVREARRWAAPMVDGPMSEWRLSVHGRVQLQTRLDRSAAPLLVALLPTTPDLVAWGQRAGHCLANEHQAKAYAEACLVVLALHDRGTPVATIALRVGTPTLAAVGLAKVTLEIEVLSQTAIHRAGAAYKVAACAKELALSWMATPGVGLLVRKNPTRNGCRAQATPEIACRAIALIGQEDRQLRSARQLRDSLASGMACSSAPARQQTQQTLERTDQ